MSVIAIHTVLASLVRDEKGVSLTRLVMHIASGKSEENPGVTKGDERTGGKKK